jgi:hypothetical protein
VAPRVTNALRFVDADFHPQFLCTGEAPPFTEVGASRKIAGSLRRINPRDNRFATAKVILLHMWRFVKSGWSCALPLL